MKKENRKTFYCAVGLLAAFLIWTFGVRFVDVQAIGPRGTTVGFGTINRFFHTLTGVNMLLYIVTDWLGLVPIGFCLGFGVLGLCQWIKRKSFRKVDGSILVLGGFYLMVMAMYVLFEFWVMNRRPVLIDGFLEASYPSSTTMLILCVMPTAMMQLKARIKHKALNMGVCAAICGFTAFMVIGRLISGVHWLSDIIGGGLLSGGLVMLYSFFCQLDFILAQKNC